MQKYNNNINIDITLIQSVNNIKEYKLLIYVTMHNPHQNNALFHITTAIFPAKANCIFLLMNSVGYIGGIYFLYLSDDINIVL